MEISVNGSNSNAPNQQRSGVQQQASVPFSNILQQEQSAQEAILQQGAQMQNALDTGEGFFSNSGAGDTALGGGLDGLGSLGGGATAGLSGSDAAFQGVFASFQAQMLDGMNKLNADAAEGPKPPNSDAVFYASMSMVSIMIDENSTPEQKEKTDERLEGAVVMMFSFVMVQGDEESLERLAGIYQNLPEESESFDRIQQGFEALAAANPNEIDEEGYDEGYQDPFNSLFQNLQITTEKLFELQSNLFQLFESIQTAPADKIKDVFGQNDFFNSELGTDINENIEIDESDLTGEEVEEIDPLEVE